MSRDVKQVWVRMKVPLASPTFSANAGAKIEVDEDYARELVEQQAAEYFQPEGKVGKPAKPAVETSGAAAAGDEGKPSGKPAKPKKPGKGKQQRNDPTEVETRVEAGEHVSGQTDEASADGAETEPPAE